MRRTLQALVVLTVMSGLSWTGVANAQDIGLQSMLDESLDAVRDRLDRASNAERRRSEQAARAAERRAEAQTLLLQEQALAVQRLADEVRTLRDERELIRQIEAFDAAMTAGDWTLARSFLADTLTIDLAGPGFRTLAADTLLLEWSRASAGVRARPTGLRPNGTARIDAERATVTADGVLWNWVDPARRSGNPRPGTYEYRFARTDAGWRIDGLSFRPLGL